MSNGQWTKGKFETNAAGEWEQIWSHDVDPEPDFEPDTMTDSEADREYAADADYAAAKAFG